MNTYAKYCPNVWLAKCVIEYQRGDIIQVTNKYGKEVECEIHNLIVKNANGYFYSITRCDGLNRQTYAERKAEKYQSWAKSAENKSAVLWEKSNEGLDFLSLGEPIKIGHHSEGRHRALIARNHARIGKSIEQSNKAESHEQKADYWDFMAGKIDLSMPESIEYFTHELETAAAHHQGLKDGTKERVHSMSLAYASKAVKELKAKIVTANKLWGVL